MGASVQTDNQNKTYVKPKTPPGIELLSCISLRKHSSGLLKRQSPFALFHSWGSTAEPPARHASLRTVPRLRVQEPAVCCISESERN